MNLIGLFDFEPLFDLSDFDLKYIVIALALVQAATLIAIALGQARHRNSPVEQLARRRHFGV